MVNILKFQTLNSILFCLIFFFFFLMKLFLKIHHGMPALVVKLDAPSDETRRFNPLRGWQHSFVEIDHEIRSFSPFR